MTEAIRQSKTTYNDETRILVRSRIDKNAPFKYNVEYIHAALSLEKKLVSMVYDEGTRSHEVQEKAFFRESNIKLFMADRAPIYSTIVKDLEEYEIERAACWVHSRRLFINAFRWDVATGCTLAVTMQHRTLLSCTRFRDRRTKQEQKASLLELCLARRRKTSVNRASSTT